jgi:hypothetical protein
MSYSPRTALVGAAVSFALTTLARVDDTGSLGTGHVASSTLRSIRWQRFVEMFPRGTHSRAIH